MLRERVRLSEGRSAAPDRGDHRLPVGQYGRERLAVQPGYDAGKKINGRKRHIA